MAKPNAAVVYLIAFALAVIETLSLIVWKLTRRSRK
jgi:hypothetical protein